MDQDSKQAEEMPKALTTENLKSFLKFATKEIEDLTGQNNKLKTRCDELRQEKENVDKANSKLIAKAQHLRREESLWVAERARYESKIEALKAQLSKADIKESEEGAKQESKKDQQKKDATDVEIQDRARVRKISRISTPDTSSNEDTLVSSSTAAPGEGADEVSSNSNYSKRVYHLTVSLQTQVHRLKDRCQVLEEENAKLKSAGLNVADANLAQQQGARYEKLLDDKKKLTERAEGLRAENAALTAENGQLQKRCQHLEDLLAEEEADINDVIGLLDKMQVTSSTNPNPGPLVPQLINISQK